MVAFENPMSMSKPTVGGIVVVLALVIGAICCLIYGAGPVFLDTSATPSQAYTTLFDQRMPDSVSTAECHGALWMDYEFSLRFTTLELDEKQILGLGYRQTDWSEIRQRFEEPPYFEEFEGRWLTGEVQNVECYSRTIVSEGLVEEHYVVIDRNQNLVFAVGAGIVG